MSSDAPEGRRAARAATLLAIGIAFLFFFSGYQDLIYDAWGFSELARRLSRGGLVAAAYEWRTYGYPLFVALCTGFRAADPKTVRLLVFLVQLAVYLGACAAGARILGAVFRSPGFSRATYVVTALNPFLLARTTECVSDLLSAVLVYLGVLLALPVERPPLEVAPPRLARRAALSLLCLSVATMVRPSNLAVFLAVGILWALRWVLRRELRAAAAPLLLAAAILPFLPQLYANFRAFGKTEPLVVQSLYRSQAHWGMGGLKYGALVRPGEPPQVLYRNPLYRGESSPVLFLRRRPIAYAATLGLHLFAMFDHDFVLTYPTAPHPWYRWPLSLVNYAFLFLCLAGITVFLRRRPPDDPGGSERFAGFALLFAAAASVALYLPTLVESRFAAPAELLLTPFLVLAILRMRALRGPGSRPLLAGAIAGVLFMAACAGLSAWIAAQAPRLAAAPTSAPRTAFHPGRRFPVAIVEGAPA